MINYAFSVSDLEYFLLILIRITSFVGLAPFFGMNNTPRNVKIALSVFVSAMLYRVLTPTEAVAYNSLMAYSIIVIKEAIVGLLLGFATSLCTSILNFAGSVADMEIGLSMVQLMDPATNQMTSFTGAIYNYGFMMIMIASGMYRYLLGALADSFRLIPIGGAVFDSEKLLESMLVYMSDYILIGFRVILPIFCTILMLNAILGIMAKVSPQMNMFAVGIQIKIIVGLSVIFLTISLLPSISDMVNEEMQKMMVLFAEAMM